MTGIDSALERVMKAVLYGFPACGALFVLHLLISGKFMAVVLWCGVLAFDYWLYTFLGRLGVSLSTRRV